MLHLLQFSPAVRIEPDGTARTGPKPVAVLPGSFDPLHHGHAALARAAAAHLGVDGHCELSVTNADKPELPRDEVERRAAQFAGVGPVWVTRAATFEAKADLFPGAAFVLGWDTAVRVIDPKYYGGEPGRDAALRKLVACGCRLVVGGRITRTAVSHPSTNAAPGNNSAFASKVAARVTHTCPTVANCATRRSTSSRGSSGLSAFVTDSSK